MFDCCCCLFCSRWGITEAGVVGGGWGIRGVCLTVSINGICWGVDVSFEGELFVSNTLINCSSVSRTSCDVRPGRFLTGDVDDAPW